jgi:hypothetical protein
MSPIKGSIWVLYAAVLAPSLVAQLPMSRLPGPWARTIEAIRQVDSAVVSLSTPEAARQAGFEPTIFGWIPTMGTHWLNHARLPNDKTFSLLEPTELMFSPVNGTNTLVGVAYAYLTQVTDTTRPYSFDGAAAWHEHPDLAPAGMTMVMLHLWLVPSPDGPFASHNPYLPYWALEVSPPDPEKMKDEQFSTRARKAALALSVVADTRPLFPLISRQPWVFPVLTAERDMIRTLVPQLKAAQAEHNWTQWEQIADQLASHWDHIRQAYLESTIDPRVSARIADFMDGMVATHHQGHHQ